MGPMTPNGLWTLTKRMTGALLALWLVMSLVGPWFARDLDRLTGQGRSFGFWVAAEGALLIYLAIVVVYVIAMDRIERRYLDADGLAADPRDTVAR
jgi:putative solute:sodium symporter small subunit